MATDPPEATGGTPPGPPRGYGVTSGAVDGPGQVRPPERRPAPPEGTAHGVAPVYGRVHRYGPAPAAAPTGGTTPGWPPPPVSIPAPGPDPSWASRPPSSTPVAPPPVPGPWSPQPWGAVPVTRPRRADYAPWGRRVLGWVVDALPSWIAAAVLTTGYLPLYAGLLRGDLRATPHDALVLVGTLLSVAAFGWQVYNRWFLAGRTGQSLGKRVARTWLVSQDSGRPVGALAAFVRDLLHVLDGLGYVGYLWPLWDDERQTLADKVARTVVVRTPVTPLVAGEARHLVA